ncbi:hypothetical protein SAMN05216456_1454 [Devosia crocina]|uniref:Uncharacterized protein n=1 Tax=Devosia crocina TaxID=429728 RepID=A0A1I7NAT7_9HYPH|nr:hypothetical protein SAMN05216456_1454 [Devosia crocina]
MTSASVDRGRGNAMTVLNRKTILDGLRAAAVIRAGELPTEADLANAPTLTLWTYEPLSGEFYRLAGIVAGHPRLPDGSCFTSAVLAIDPCLKWARTVSRFYKLGPSILEITKRENSSGA